MGWKAQELQWSIQRHPNTIMLAVLALALLPGLLLNPNPALPFPTSYISQIAGWLYATAWGLSFYPQILTNWKNKSIEGFSPDFALANTLGFVALSVYYSSLYWSSYVRALYRQHNRGSDNSVRSNDVATALHAAAVTAFTLWQCFHYNPNVRFSWPCLLSVGTVVVAMVLWSVSAAVFAPESVLMLLYTLSYVKLAVTIFKYIPQVILNWRRKSTEGWDLRQVLLDVFGGSLSIFQLFLEAAVLHDWTLVSGNIVKLGLGVVSLSYDSVLISQHIRYTKTYSRFSDEAEVSITST